jgi:hypothetical protein
MLIDLNQKPQAGDSFPLTLTFEKAGPRDVTVKVEPLGAMGPSDGADVTHNGTRGAADQNRLPRKAMSRDGSHSTQEPGL